MITLLHIADVHSHLFSEPMVIGEFDAALGLGVEGQSSVVGGVARLGTAIEEARDDADRSVTLDSGDIFEGTDVFNEFGGVPELRSLGILGVDATTLGNHDLALGASQLASLRSTWVGFPLVAANLPSELDEGLVVKSVLIDRQGVRVAVIGVGYDPDHAPDVNDAAASVQAQIDAVRSGTDVVVILSHIGSDLDRQLVPLTTGADVVLGGHTHDVLAPPVSVLDCGAALSRSRGCRRHPVLVVHSGAYGRYLGRVDLELSDEPADLATVDSVRPTVVVGVRSTLIPVNDAVPVRTDVSQLLAPYAAALASAGLTRPIAFAPKLVSRDESGGGDSALGNFVTGLMRTATGADVALTNSTGIRADIQPGNVDQGAIFEVLPFDDRLIVGTVPGSTLLRALTLASKASCSRDEQSQLVVDGARVILHCDGPETADDITVGGQALDVSATYRVAASSFLTGGGGWVGMPPSATDTGTVRDAVLATLRLLPHCPSGVGADFPCIDVSSGAAVDGRIGWH